MTAIAVEMVAILMTEPAGANAIADCAAAGTWANCAGSLVHGVGSSIRAGAPLGD